MKKTVFLLAIAQLFLCVNLFAQTDEDRLLANENLKSNELSFENQTPLLMPQTEFSEQIREFVFGNFTDKVGHSNEKLYVVSKKYLVEHNGLSAAPSQITVQDAGVLMRSISQMQGMRYYSRSDKDWDVLYKEAFRVEGPDGQNEKNAVADLTEGSADGKTIYAFMNDHTFGKSWYKLSYRQTDKELVMFMENTSALTYGPVRAVVPGKFRMCAAVLDQGDSFLVYMCDYAEFKIIKSLKKRLNNSFDARLEAIYLWFCKKMGEIK